MKRTPVASNTDARKTRRTATVATAAPPRDHLLDPALTTTRSDAGSASGASQHAGAAASAHNSTATVVTRARSSLARSMEPDATPAGASADDSDGAFPHPRIALAGALRSSLKGHRPRLATRSLFVRWQGGGRVRVGYPYHDAFTLPLATQSSLASRKD